MGLFPSTTHSPLCYISYNLCVLPPLSSTQANQSCDAPQQSCFGSWVRSINVGTVAKYTCEVGGSMQSRTWSIMS